MSLNVSEVLLNYNKYKKIKKTMDCQKETNLENCPCTYEGCPRKGLCCECIEYHRKRDEMPACFFSKETEKTYDRSIERFIKDYRNNQ